MSKCNNCYHNKVCIDREEAERALEECEKQ